MEEFVSLRERIRQAAQAARRDPQEITLVGVAKGQPVSRVAEAVSAGLTDIGENYAQELLGHVRAPELADLGREIRWHFIGRLQRNKVKAVLPHLFLIHSVDSLTLAHEIELRAASLPKIQPILIEVRTDPASSKTGLLPREVSAFVTELTSLQHIDLQGFMTIPPPSEDLATTRAAFRALREIRDEINRERGYRHPLPHLSMGMTSDFEVAIEEGATIVRIGRALFGERR